MIKKYFQKIKNGLAFSVAGFKVTLDETAFQMELLLGIPAILFALFSYKTKAEKALLILSIFSVLIMELLNTAIEKFVDRLSTEIHPLSKKIKDVASCLVFFTVIAAAMIWFTIFFL